MLEFILAQFELLIDGLETAADEVQKDWAMQDLKEFWTEMFAGEEVVETEKYAVRNCNGQFEIAYR